MNIIVVIIIGLIIGAVAKFLMPGRDPGGFVLTSLLGIGGAVAAAYIGQVVGWYRYGEPVGFIAAVLGAMLLLLIYRFATGGRKTLKS
ncbi:MAG: GlsB/YeaQ/YmgE family stress response membrane protein [Deltaproteobacteria bacterium CG11_big_fil_rev_8_21_14_0_20_45_16]|nr:MAG: GlsB/YeaQ/YmgE family stress response membrane protein [Deltaproteobacteria bacterium CG11_big_fil_rev_8_21_14_0_20_45_16]